MIHGIGTDVCRVERFERMLERYGERAARRVLGGRELSEFSSVVHPARFLARRFAAKEAFAKAIGTGIREPVFLSAMQVGHDGLGKPFMECGGALAAMMSSAGLTAHLSISDEEDLAVAFVVIERSVA
ncbi:MAG TPA: holo-ACP synthase [Rhodocyclaceae bacterium]|nr:holo-ACP synthase [Rhodocyclaceae bacterium]